VPEDIEITSVADMLTFWRANNKDFNLFIKRYFSWKVRDMDNDKHSFVYKTPIWGVRKANPIRCSTLRNLILQKVKYLFLCEGEAAIEDAEPILQHWNLLYSKIAFFGEQFFAPTKVYNENSIIINEFHYLVGFYAWIPYPDYQEAELIFWSNPANLCYCRKVFIVWSDLKDETLKLALVNRYHHILDGFHKNVFNLRFEREIERIQLLINFFGIKFKDEEYIKFKSRLDKARGKHKNLSILRPCSIKYLYYSKYNFMHHLHSSEGRIREKKPESTHKYRNFKARP